jgi:phage FluMu protein Com
VAENQSPPAAKYLTGGVMPDIQCAGCNRWFAADPNLRGHKVRCPDCGTVARVPFQSPPEPPRTIHVHDPATSTIRTILVIAAVGLTFLIGLGVCLLVLSWVFQEAAAGRL